MSKSKNAAGSSAYIEKFIAAHKEDKERDINVVAKAACRKISSNLRISFMKASADVEIAETSLDKAQELLEKSYLNKEGNIETIISAMNEVAEYEAQLEKAIAKVANIEKIAAHLGIDVNKTVG
jgi:hypothetical protein